MSTTDDRCRPRPCPGSGSIADCTLDQDWCWCCGRIYAVRNDGTLRAHRMDYARIVAYTAIVVRDVEIRTGRRLPTDNAWVGAAERTLLTRLDWV